MEPVSQFQKQILAEMGIVSWKLRSNDEDKSHSPQALAVAPQSSSASQATAHPQKTATGGLSGLELIKQQMAKSPDPKVDSTASSTPKEREPNAVSSEAVKPSPKVAYPQAPSVESEPDLQKPTLELKSEVLVWQSKEIPLSDLILSFESLDIPYQLVDSDSNPVNRFPLLIATQTPENFVADKVLPVQSGNDKKQVWQALQAFKQSQGNAN